MEKDGYLTIKQFCEKYPWPDEQGMRRLILRKEELHLEEAFAKVGGRVIIKVKKFFELIDGM